MPNCCSTEKPNSPDKVSVMDKSKIMIHRPDKDTVPDKILGTEKCCAKMYIKKLDDTRQVMRIEIDADFSWKDNIKPILPGCPDWCPATHFGYLESGEMEVEMKNGEICNILAGDTYLVPPDHVPVFKKKTVMIEFIQDTTYTNKDFGKNENN